MALCAFSSPGISAKTPATESGTAPLASIQINQLSKEAQATWTLIHQGGPFLHSKDGAVFRNRERLLPAAPGGYYREYTVRTAGARNRGASRIVCGGHRPAIPNACFYTSDHYASFSRIVQ